MEERIQLPLAEMDLNRDVIMVAIICCLLGSSSAYLTEVTSIITDPKTNKQEKIMQKSSRWQQSFYDETKYRNEMEIVFSPAYELDSIVG